MNIIGLGNAGSEIAKNFEIYSQYRVFCIDTENNGYPTFIKIEYQNSHESYEKNYKELNLPGIAGPTTLILSGAGNISGAALRLLEQLKACPITVIYVKSDPGQLASEARTREKITFGILQQYARSALLETLYIVSNKEIEEVVDNLTLKNYWQDINNVISSTYHMLNVYENTEPLLNTSPPRGESSRIGTFGVVGYETKEEKLFYKLQYPRVKKYIYGINDDLTDNDKNLLHGIRSFAASQKEEKNEVGFSIYTTSYEYNHIYAIYYASCIQEQILE